MAGSFSGAIMQKRGSQVDITLLQGASVSIPVTIGVEYVPVDGAMQARLTPDTVTAAVEFTTALNRVTVLGQVVTFHMTATDSAGLVPDNYIYDMEITDGTGATHRIMGGSFIVSPEVTRP